ncbi:MAG: Type II secretion system protein G [Candidatus Woesebacteria bacterium GW2011_GWB1_43_14]|uniref:Type II secretion system protein G n=1 Tax=Candidatus Woesebacteria bacterium GW2011_GWB1_43_14 TaxID=1618578 RepID=A0A0G1FPT3_9BACT|nr:MAG: fimbrial protein pilin [Candidatus Woesebacteria bacterium GW2011_GWC1_42_9]KKS97041.1 MAG: Type II secretion system protein G [Candidatus Woesebacteria bacterium GW2011_GWB1_43_14]
MKKGFTLIELLIVLAIIGILVTISAFGLREARKSARDATRKSDLEQIRSALALFRADCGYYPDSPDLVFGAPLLGDDGSTSCSSGNTYLSEIPQDALEPEQQYFYARTSPTSYVLCTALENSTDPAPVGCVSCGVSCNYKVTSL